MIIGFSAAVGTPGTSVPLFGSISLPGKNIKSFTVMAPPTGNTGATFIKALYGGAYTSCFAAGLPLGVPVKFGGETTGLDPTSFFIDGATANNSVSGFIEY